MIRLYVAYALVTAATVVMIGAVVFLAAWTLHYWQAWILLVAMFSGYGVGIVGSLARRDPVPIRPRRSGEARIDKRRIETPTSQRIIESLVPLGFVALLVVSGLDHRFGWSSARPRSASPPTSSSPQAC
ncbi:hypothetical protein [Nocardia colli]|uniref:hypothetical protein n=1 Tax=Nocardia colli TaxID=2545717 RepID=UPI0035DB1F82